MKNAYTIAELKKFMSERNSLRKEKEVITNRQNDIFYLLKDGCHCPENHRIPKSDYFGGSYDCTSYTETWESCTFCNKKHNVKIKDHGYYG
jgi:hypothetical protein